MNKEKQDKLWNCLSTEEKVRQQNNYKDFSEANQALDKGALCMLVEIFGEHNLQPSSTYEDVSRILFKEGAWQPHDYASKYYLVKNAEPTYLLNCTSQKQSEKLVAINKLLNVAKYLNKNEDGTDWVPDFDDENNEFYTISIDPDDDSVRIIDVNMQRVRTEIVYFRTHEIAQQAVQILGEDVVRTALTTEY